MSRKEPQPQLPTWPCDAPGCLNRVQTRKESKSGLHFCPDPKCQAAKQKAYRSRRREGNPSINEARRQLVADVAHLERAKCGYCQLENALPGWAHRDMRNPEKICTGVGRRGAELGGGGFLDAIHPELVPS